jgi:outer membrane protein assembly factor BamB
MALGFSRCIEEWPHANGSHQTRMSLAVDAPRVVWKTQMHWGLSPSGPYDAGPVVSKQRLAVQTADRLIFVNKDGSDPQDVKYSPVGDLPSNVAADAEGNVYFVARDGVYSVDATGKLLWNRLLGSNSGGEGEFATHSPPVLGPDGVLYATTSSEDVVALRTSDGSVLWSYSAFGNTYSPKILGGGGKSLFVTVDAERTDALDTGTGELLGSPIRPKYGRSLGGDWGGWVEGWEFGIAYSNGYVFDQCGSFKWSKEPYGKSGVIAAGELMVVAPPDKLALFNAAGEMVAGPSSAKGHPVAAGADGTIYTVDGRIVLAHLLDLTELWRLDLGSGAEITGTVVLDDDGMMYLVHPSESGGTELVAIQTRSPGLADSSWPSIRHDNRGTAWLVPGVPNTVSLPTAATQTP